MIETRDGKLIRPNEEVVDVKIVDRGEGLEKGQPPNHDKVEIIYISPKSEKVTIHIRHS